MTQESAPRALRQADKRNASIPVWLEIGPNVDDITTAIQTGWKMLGEPNPPSISFHKETKLLIAVGELDKLETIDAALKALDGRNPKPGTVPASLSSAPQPGKADSKQ